MSFFRAENPLKDYTNKSFRNFLNENSTKLVVFDFDLTITKNHTVSEIKYQTNEEVIKKNVQDEWVDLVNYLNKEGIYVAIVSFAETDVIERYLKIHLGESFREKVIHVAGNDYYKGEPSLKVEQCKKIMEQCRVSSKKQVMFIDDSKENCQATANAGIPSLHFIYARYNLKDIKQQTSKKENVEGSEKMPLIKAEPGDSVEYEVHPTMASTSCCNCLIL